MPQTPDRKRKRVPTKTKIPPRPEDEDVVVRAFAKVGRALILGHFPPRSSIPSCRIAESCLRAFGIPSRLVPVTFRVFAPDLSIVYYAGIAPVPEADAPPVTEIVEAADGWNGHLILETRHFVIDPSFDQAIHAIAAHRAAFDSVPLVAVFPLERGEHLPPGEFTITFRAVLEGGGGQETTIEAQYAALFDDGYKHETGWQRHELKPVIAAICLKMNEFLKMGGGKST